MGSPRLPSPAWAAELEPGFQLPHWVLEEVEVIGERQREKEGRWAGKQAEGMQGWGRGEQPVRPPSPRGPAPRGPPCSSPSPTPMMGEEGGSGQPLQPGANTARSFPQAPWEADARQMGILSGPPFPRPAPAPWTLHKSATVLHRFGNQCPHRCEHGELRPRTGP